MSHLRPLALAALLVAATAAPAHALQFGKSSTTGESVFMVPLRTGIPLPANFELNGGLRLLPGLSSAFGPVPVLPGSVEAFSGLGDLDLELAYRYTFVDLDFFGRFNPSIAPYVGYRGLGAVTAVGSLAGAATTLNTLHGLHYGVGADTEIPFGFRAYAHGGLTTLLSGGWSPLSGGGTSGSINPGGATLPGAGIGLAWHLGPFFSIGVGYDVFQLPTDMRAQATTLGPGRTTLNNLTVSIGLLGFAF